MVILSRRMTDHSGKIEEKEGTGKETSIIAGKSVLDSSCNKTNKKVLKPKLRNGKNNSREIKKVKTKKTWSGVWCTRQGRKELRLQDSTLSEQMGGIIH